MGRHLVRLTECFGHLRGAIKRLRHEHRIGDDFAVTLEVLCRPVNQVPDLGDVEQVAGGEEAFGAHKALTHVHVVIGQGGAIAGRHVGFPRHPDPQKVPHGDLVKPAADDVRGGQMRAQLLQVRRLDALEFGRQRLPREPHAAVGQVVGAKGDGIDQGAVAGVAHPVDLLVGGAVDIGVEHAETDGIGPHLPDLGQCLVGAGEMADLRHGVSGHVIADVADAQRGDRSCAA